MMLSFLRTALAAAALAGASPALAQTVPVRSGPHAGPYIAYGPVCDRAGVRDCQRVATVKMMALCDPFPGRFACADRVLAEQSACLAATGCD